MGNAELRRLSTPSALLDEEVDRLRVLHVTFGGDVRLEKTAFSNLFDPAQIPYTFLDECFELFDVQRNGYVDLGEVALMICLGMHPSPAQDMDAHLRQRFRFLFQVFDRNGDKLLTRAELREWLLHMATANISRQSKYIYNTDRTFKNVCRGCQCALHTQSHMMCMDCVPHHVFGIPQLDFYCNSCAKSHRHSTQHRLVVRGPGAVPNASRSAVHDGMECSACSVCPIVGVLYECEDCLDGVALCANCYEDGAEPQSHVWGRHRVVQVDRAVSLATRVSKFVDHILNEGDLNEVGYLTADAFVRWAVDSEFVWRYFSGSTLVDVRPCECEEFVVEDTHRFWFAEEVGIVPLEDVSEKSLRV